MTRERPLAIAVLARAGLVLGGIGLLAGGTVLALCLSFSTPASSCLIVPLSPSVAFYCRAHVFAFEPFELVLPSLALLLPGLVLAVSLGLRLMRPWAPSAALVVAALTLFAFAATLLYEFAVLMPAVEQWRSGTMARSAPGHYNVPVPAEGQWVAILLLIGALVFFVHALVTLVVLRSPAVGEAFADRPPASEGEKASCPHNCSTATS